MLEIIECGEDQKELSSCLHDEALMSIMRHCGATLRELKLNSYLVNITLSDNSVILIDSYCPI